MLRRKNMQLLLLALVFACPGLAAWQFYLHPNWLGQTSTNKGQLLKPPVRIAFPNAKAKWRLLLWSPEGCKMACRQQLDTLARVRLALGRRLYEVDEWLVQNSSEALPDALLAMMKEQDIHLRILSQPEQKQNKALGDSAKIFVANPDNYLILSYPATVKPDDIYHDLKHLLLSNEKQSV